MQSIEGDHLHDSTFRILVADDDEASRSLIRDSLDEQAFELIEARDGAEALALCETARPDLLILDTRMPEISGFELVRHIRTQESNSLFLPVLLITASGDPGDRLRGLEEGADDFLQKPVDPVELRYRIRRFLKLRRSNQALHQRCEEMKDVDRYKDDMLGFLIHDLKSPLTVMMTNISFVCHELGDSVGEEIREAMVDAMSGGEHLLRLLSNILDVRRLESNRFTLKLERGDIRDLLETIRKDQHRVSEQSDVKLEIVGETQRVVWDDEIIRRVIENILSNAIRYTPRGGRIALEILGKDDKCHVAIRNTGPRIPQSARKLLFRKYGQLAGRRIAQGMNLGLGLYFCRLAIEAHGGEIWLEESEMWPVSFVFSLKRQPL